MIHAINPAGKSYSARTETKEDAHELIEHYRADLMLKGRHVLLQLLLTEGERTIDDVRERLDIPATVDPTALGGIPGPLARAGIIASSGYRQSSRKTAHSRPITIWRIIDRSAAQKWLSENPLPE